jgi:hypothetical protein
MYVKVKSGKQEDREKERLDGIYNDVMVVGKILDHLELVG